MILYVETNFVLELAYLRDTSGNTLDKVDAKALAQNTAALAGLAYAIAEDGL